VPLSKPNIVLRAIQGKVTKKRASSSENDQFRDYAVLTAVFNVALATFLFCRRRSSLPERIDPPDLILLGLATQKLSRLATRSKVMIPLRAPFTKESKPSGSGEVEETPRGTGIRKTIGELLTCPFCIGTWISLALLIAFSWEPRLARFIAGIFAVGSVADFAQQGYCVLKENNE
jgi:hypothetical protein